MIAGEKFLTCPDLPVYFPLSRKVFFHFHKEVAFFRMVTFVYASVTTALTRFLVMWLLVWRDGGLPY